MRQCTSLHKFVQQMLDHLRKHGCVSIGVRDLPLREGYDIPGCVEDGAWMLWETSSVAVAAVAVAVAAVAHPDSGNGQLSFYYEIGASGVRGSIRLVFRVPKVILKNQISFKQTNINKRVKQTSKTVKTGIA